MGTRFLLLGPASFLFLAMSAAGQRLVNTEKRVKKALLNLLSIQNKCIRIVEVVIN